MPFMGLKPVSGGRAWSTNFGNYTTGSPPSDWTVRWDSISSITVETGTGLGGKELTTATSSNGAYAVSWDTPDSLADVEALCKIKIDGNDSDGSVKVFVRGGGGSSTRVGYYLRFIHNSDTVTLNVYDDPGASSATLDSAAFSGLARDIWYWVRIRAIGSSIKAKVWQDGNSEPGTWTLEATDTTITAAGWQGFGWWTDSEAPEVDYYSVASGGLTAPGP